ncbi:MAG: hypothetical protein WC607_01250 [Candidatus Micrarchaeia archaeon]
MKLIANGYGLTALLLAALLLAAPLASAQEEEMISVPFVFQFYFLYGTSVGECDANCVGSCMSPCYAAAAAAGGLSGTSNCGSVCPSRCASECAAVFSNAYQADDGLPSTPFEPECSYGSYTACEVPQQSVSEIEPSWPVISEGTPSLDGPGMLGGGTESDGEYDGGAGITVEPQTCAATAPDGHPLRWDQIWGCYDIFWKNDYCAVATGCNTGVPCTGRQGCIWNGASCVPCNAPTCIYSCPGTGGGPAAPADRVTAVQNEIPAPTAAPTRQAGGTPTPVPSAAPAQPTPTAIPTATPAPVCGAYGNCKACVNAAKEEGESVCGWSEFLNICMDGDTWRAVNASGLKAGWADEEKYCPVQAEVYCFEFTDCFSCAGNAGVKRECLWSTTQEKCEPYDAFGDFKTEDNPKGKDVILPTMCSERDCSAYSGCAECEGNAACIWPEGGDECSTFKGDGEGAYFFPSACPDATIEAVVAAPTSVPCPAGCKCNSQAKPVSCGGKSIDSASLVSVDRAVVNAGASLQRVNEVEFNQAAAGGNASYAVRGSRSGVVFFVLPVSFDVTAVVNAETGEVESVEQPWWSVLVG